MADKKQFGIYWGDHSFCFVEAEKGKLLKSSSVAFSTPISNYQSQEVPEGLRYTTLIQKALQDLSITTKKVNLSLPAKDIIFRSFVIPAMEPNEIKNVVDFEAIKYIPIKLEDLSYTFHPIPVNENNQKNLRIIFVAIRKDVLSKYISVLEHTGLSVEWVEASPMSLMRVLEQKGLLPRKHGSAVVQIEEQGGKIIFVDQDVVQFVREFQLPGGDHANASEFETFSSRLFNEIRVSLNFYSRQNPQGKISKIIALSAQDLSPLAKSLSENVGIPASLLPMSSILKASAIQEIGLLNALGVAFRDKKSAFNNFNLSMRTGPKMPGAGMGGFDTAKYKKAAIAVVLALTTIALVFSLTKNMNSHFKQKLAELQSAAGPYEASTTENIKEMQKKVNDKFNSYKDVQLKSNLNFYLARIPQLLPPGTWLKSWDFIYNEDKVSIEETVRLVSRLSMTIEGYAYVENTNEQFRLVNKLLTTLKNTPDISSSFSKIDLITVQQENLENHPVTYFRIDFK